jgi:predicted PurR-regulated permease PerM
MKIKEWVETVGVGTILTIFLFTTFATVGHVERIAAETRSYVDQRHEDVLDRIKDIQETARRIEDRLNRDK